VAESGILAEGAKAESHRANAVAFLLTQTNLYPKVLGRGQPKVPACQRAAIADATSATAREAFGPLFSYVSLRSNVFSDSAEQLSKTPPFARRLQVKSGFGKLRTDFRRSGRCQSNRA